MAESLRGKFLVASPMLGDANFFRTVVLMLQHDEEGAMGLVLTRPTSMTVQEVLEKLREEMGDDEPLCLSELIADQPIQLGGPVPGPLIAIHDLLDCSESEVLPGLYVATQRATLDRLLGSDADVRLFSGYSGWGPGQLENELSVGGWLATEATGEAALGDPETIWDVVIGQIGQEILNLDQRHMLPDDPSMN